MVLVDSSVWIEYFNGNKKADKLDLLIDRDIIVINDLILTELIPFLKIKKQNKLINILGALRKLELKIDWSKIIEIQYRCLKKGINGIGIPDLIIAQNVMQHKCKLYTFDHHFSLVKKILKIELHN